MTERTIMRKIPLLFAGLALVLPLTACGEDAADETIATGVHNIEAPADAVNIEQGEDVFIADLPQWDYEEVADWMGGHLATDSPVIGLELRSDERHEAGHDWCFSGEPNEDGEYDMVTVFISSGAAQEETPVSMMVASASGVPLGCLP